MKKKILVATSYAAVAALAIGGTMAYFTATDDDVNVFTVGNVKIEQHEYQRAEGVSHINAGAKEGDLVPFEQGKTLIPAVPANNLNSDYTAEELDERQFWWGVYTKGNGSNGLWNDDNLSNVMDKFVFVENTGKTDAYYRTVIAFECPEGMSYGESPSDGSEFMMNINANSRFDWTENGYTVIDGTRYLLKTATYNEILAPGEISRPSLLQIVMTHNATSEDAELLGDTYEVLVASQAVQADGNLTSEEMLNKAFGEITETTHPWANTVSDAAELKEALAAGGSVILDADVTLDEVIEVNGDVQILGNGHTITAPANGTRILNIKDNTEPVSIMISGATLEAADVERGVSFYNNEGGLVVDIIDSEITAGHYGVNVASENVDPVLNIKDSTLTGYCAFQTWSANTVATFDNCVLNGVNKWSGETNAFATIVVNDTAVNSTLTFNNCTITATATGDQPEYHVINNAEAAIEFNDCTFIDNGEVVGEAVKAN